MNLCNENTIVLGLLQDYVTKFFINFINVKFYKIFNLEIMDLRPSNVSLMDNKIQIFNVKFIFCKKNLLIFHLNCKANSIIFKDYLNFINFNYYNFPSTTHFYDDDLIPTFFLVLWYWVSVMKIINQIIYFNCNFKTILKTLCYKFFFEFLFLVFPIIFEFDYDFFFVSNLLFCEQDFLLV